jgi:hypothetical protein
MGSKLVKVYWCFVNMEMNEKDSILGIKVCVWEFNFNGIHCQVNYLNFNKMSKVMSILSCYKGKN